MSKQDDPLDSDFIQSQRQRLEAMQSELRASLEFREDNELQMQEARMNTSHASGGDAQESALQDNDRAVRAHGRMRLQTIHRALEKIQDGSYGRSDESGDPIPRARLLAVPASLLTVEEEQAHERRAAREP